MRFLLPALLLAAVTLVGCSDDGPSTVEDDWVEYETDLSDPENVLVNLARAHLNRDPDTYADLLGARFQFLPSFFSPWGREIPDRDRDVALTRAMFLSPDVEEIRLDITFGEPDMTLFGGVEESIRIRSTSLLLDVDVTGDVTLRVDDHVQQFYLQPGRTEDGEDPGRYYIRAWDDTGAVPGALRAGDSPVPVDERTWSVIKKEFDE
jgi:hypothetical protein